MPGETSEFTCTGCNTRYALTRGGGQCRTCKAWFHYTQQTCPHCHTLTSVTEGCAHAAHTGSCQHCDSELQQWTGRTFFTKDEHGRPIRETIEGPCPRCQEPLEPAKDGPIILWD